MKKQRRKFEKPLKPYDKVRIEKEKEILKKYGLRRKKEIWRAESILRNFRRRARRLVAEKNKEKEKEILKKLEKLGLVNKNADLDDVLALEVENILERRLQTLVHKKGLSNTLKHARQSIVHGYITVNNRRVRWPSMIINIEQESRISLKR